MTAPEAPLDRLLEHRAWVRGLVRSIVLDPGRADDVEQEVWLTAIRRGDASIEKPRAWLATVARNWARRGLRGAVRRGRREAAVARPEVVEEDVDPVERAEAHRKVVSAVLALPEPLRRTVLLHYFDGLTVEETAKRLGAPHETVRSRLRLARGRLRDTLGPSHDAAWRPALLAVAGLPKGNAGAAAGAGSVAFTGGVVAMTTAQKLAFALVLPFAVGTAWFTARAAAPTPDASREEALEKLVARVERLEKTSDAPRPARGGEDRALLKRLDGIEARLDEQTRAVAAADPQKRATTPAPPAAALPHRPVDAQNPDDGTAESLRRIVTDASLAESKRLDALARLRMMPSGFTLDVILAARDIFGSTTSMESRDAILRDLHNVKDEALLPDARALFVAGLRDPDEKVRERAARDADAFAADPAVRQALEAVRDGDASEAVRARAAKSLEPRTRK